MGTKAKKTKATKKKTAKQANPKRAVLPGSEAARAAEMSVTLTKRWTYIVKMLDGTHLVFREMGVPHRRLEFDDGTAAAYVPASRDGHLNCREALFREVRANG